MTHRFLVAVVSVAVVVVVVGALSLMEKHLGQHDTNHGGETTKLVPVNTGMEKAIWKI
mgnify:CR=1 FL=1